MMNESSFVPSVPALNRGSLTTKTWGIAICSVSHAFLRDAVDARELPLADVHRVPEELVRPTCLKSRTLASTA